MQSALILAGAAATACGTASQGTSGGQSRAPETGSAPAGRPAAGPIWVLDHPLQLPVRKALEQRVADFEKAFPGAKVEYDGVVEPNDNSEKFAILVAAGTMPDVSATHTAFLTQYPHFSDLAPYLAKDKSLKTEDYFPTIFQAFKVPVNGTPRQIGIPREVHATMMYYARNAVQAAGLREPGKDWTHNEFVDFALKLTDWKDDPQQAKWAVQNATGLGGASSGLATFWEFGAEFFSPDGKQCIIDQPQAREAFQYLADLVLKHHVAPSPAEQTASGLTGSQQAQFATGRFRMYASNQNTAPVGSNAVPFEWDIQALPQVPGKKRATRMAGNAYGVITDGEEQEPRPLLGAGQVLRRRGRLPAADGGRELHVPQEGRGEVAGDPCPGPQRAGGVRGDGELGPAGESPQGVGQGDGAHQPGVDAGAQRAAVHRGADQHRQAGGGGHPARRRQL